MVFDGRNIFRDNTQTIFCGYIKMGLEDKSVQGMGQPRTFASVEHFDSLVDIHIAEVLENDLPLTYAGTLLFLGFNSRQSAREYAIECIEYAPSLTRIKFMCEEYLERAVVKNDCNTTGLQFLLKSLHGHKEKHFVEIAPVSIEINGVDAEL